MLVTRVVDAEPDHTVNAPLPSAMPLLTALSTAGLIVACVFTPWGLPIGAVIVSAPLFVWFWPTDRAPTIQPARTERAARAGKAGA